MQVKELWKVFAQVLIRIILTGIGQAVSIYALGFFFDPNPYSFALYLVPITAVSCGMFNSFFREVLIKIMNKINLSSIKVLAPFAIIGAIYLIVRESFNWNASIGGITFIMVNFYTLPYIAIEMLGYVIWNIRRLWSGNDE